MSGEEKSSVCAVPFSVFTLFVGWHVPPFLQNRSQMSVRASVRRTSVRPQKVSLISVKLRM